MVEMNGCTEGLPASAPSHQPLTLAQGVSLANGSGQKIFFFGFYFCLSSPISAQPSSLLRHADACESAAGRVGGWTRLFNLV